MDIKNNIDTIARILIDPSNSRFTSKEKIAAWLTTALAMIASVGTLQIVSAIWRKVRGKNEKNDTHILINQKIQKIFHKNITPPQKPDHSSAMTGKTEPPQKNGDQAEPPEDNTSKDIKPIPHAPEPEKPVPSAPEPAKPQSPAPEPARPKPPAPEPVEIKPHAPEPAKPVPSAPEPIEVKPHVPPEPAKPIPSASEPAKPKPPKSGIAKFTSSVASKLTKSKSPTPAADEAKPPAVSNPVASQVRESDLTDNQVKKLAELIQTNIKKRNNLMIGGKEYVIFAYQDTLEITKNREICEIIEFNIPGSSTILSVDKSILPALLKDIK